MVQSGLDKIAAEFPQVWKNKKLGVLCHAASVDKHVRHILTILSEKECELTALFGPQHGLFGQMQDNMIEWNGDEGQKKSAQMPVYSLYGKYRKPTTEMLSNVEIFVIDLQDVGARPYTYIWTVKLCIEACYENNIPVWILDRPNPVAPIACDGAILREDHFTFVGGAEIPLCHRMTLGEMARWVADEYYPNAEVEIVQMDGWNRSMLFSDTQLPWVIPSPNMPSLNTAIVYPGQVILETCTISEGRGTTMPFELFGASWMDRVKFRAAFERHGLEGVFLRDHDFIPTFHKYKGELCGGFQLHVSDMSRFEPVLATAAIMKSAFEIAPEGFAFTEPPYEYEYHKMPIDIVSGDDTLRQWIGAKGESVHALRELWKPGLDAFTQKFSKRSLYKESF